MEEGWKSAQASKNGRRGGMEWRTSRPRAVMVAVRENINFCSGFWTFSRGMIHSRFSVATISSAKQSHKEIAVCWRKSEVRCANNICPAGCSRHRQARERARLLCDAVYYSRALRFGALVKAAGICLTH